MISYGTASGVYGSTADIDVGNVTSFQVDLLPGTTYYFIAKAYTSADVPGPASSELAFFVPTATLTVSSTSVAGGATVSASLLNGPANPLDRVGLFAVGSNTQLDWKYLNGTQTAPATGLANATVPFVMPTAAGQYNFRLFPNGSSTPLVTSATVTVAAVANPSITPSATSVTAGGTVTATVANGPGNSLDRVGLFAVGSNTQLDWKYLNGTQTAPATGLVNASVSFVMPASSGQYNFRLLAGGSTTPLATSATVTVTASVSVIPPSINPSTTSVAAGGTLTATVANGPGNRLDWVALYPVGSTTFVDWKYLNGLQTAPATGVAGASLTFTMGTAGQYNLKFFSNNSYTLLATSATVTVSNTVTIGGSPTITSATSVAAGATFTATVANGPGNRLDWIGLYPVGSSTFVDWKYLNGLQTPPATGVTGVSLTFTAASAGQYNLKLFSNNSYTLLTTSATITVSGNVTIAGSPTITPSATSVAAGANLTATIANGPGNRLDWVALYPMGSSTFVDWKYLNGTSVAPATGLTGATLNFTMPTTPGQYTLMFFSNNSYTVLATGATVTVTGGTSSTTTSITPSATTVAAGANLTVTVANGPGNRLDWVALYPVGSSTFVDWKYLSGTSVAPATGVTGATLTFRMPTVPGQYVLKFFSNNSYTLLSTSTTVTVQ